MNVDLLKSAISGDVRKDIAQALEGDRMVTLKGDMLLIEQRGGEFKQFRLGEFFAPSKGGHTEARLSLRQGQGVTLT